MLGEKPHFLLLGEAPHLVARHSRLQICPGDKHLSRKAWAFHRDPYFKWLLTEWKAQPLQRHTNSGVEKCVRAFHLYMPCQLVIHHLSGFGSRGLIQSPPVEAIRCRHSTRSAAPNCRIHHKGALSLPLAQLPSVQPLSSLSL